MTENAKKFLEAVKEDKALEEELKDAVEGLDPKARIAVGIEFAQKKGFDIKPEDLIPDGQEVNLDELDNVAGGECGCFVGGGGYGTDEKTGERYDCACVAMGDGYVGAGDGINFSLPRQYADHDNCWCGVVGGGSD